MWNFFKLANILNRNRFVDIGNRWLPEGRRVEVGK